MSKKFDDILIALGYNPKCRPACDPLCGLEKPRLAQKCLSTFVEVNGKLYYFDEDGNPSRPYRSMKKAEDFHHLNIDFHGYKWAMTEYYQECEFMVKMKEKGYCAFFKGIYGLPIAPNPFKIGKSWYFYNKTGDRSRPYANKRQALHNMPVAF